MFSPSPYNLSLQLWPDGLKIKRFTPIENNFYRRLRKTKEFIFCDIVNFPVRDGQKYSYINQNVS